MRGEGLLGSERARVGVAAAVHVVLVDLVGHDPQALPDGPVDECLDPARRQHDAGGVVRSAQVDCRRAFRQVGRQQLDDRFRRVRVADQRHDPRFRVVAADDAGDQRPVGRENQHLVPRFENRAEHRAERAGRAGGHQDVLSPGRYAATRLDTLDDRVDQFRVPLRRSVAVHARVVLHPKILHPATFRRFQPGVADVKRKNLALVRSQAMGQGRKHGIADSRDGGGGSRVAWHGSNIPVDPLCP